MDIVVGILGAIRWLHHADAWFRGPGWPDFHDSCGRRGGCSANTAGSTCHGTQKPLKAGALYEIAGVQEHLLLFVCGTNSFRFSETSHSHFLGAAHLDNCAV